MMPKLIIMTLTWNALPMLSVLRNTLLPCLDGLDWHWHVKDNGSLDGTAQEVSTWGPNVTSHAYPNNSQNYAQGMNYLFDKANPDDEDFVLTLNNDVHFNDSDSLKRMIKLFDDKEVGLVGARLTYPGTNKLQHCGVVIESTYRLPTHFRANEQSDERDRKNREFQVVTGAVALTKAKYYRQVCQNNSSGLNGMCEKYYWMYEDVDMALCIKYNMKKKVVYCGETDISHRESETLKNNPVNKLMLNPNLRLFRERWHSKVVVDEESYKKDPNKGLYHIL